MARRSGLAAVVGLLGYLILLALILLALAVIATYAGDAAATWPREAGLITPAEDDPRWDCRVMGNGLCGEVRP